VLGFEP